MRHADEKVGAQHRKSKIVKPAMKKNPVLPGRFKFFMSLRDIGLWVRSAQTDAMLTRLQQSVSTQEAFDRVYLARSDPWGSGQACYSYQRLKYEGILSMLPPRRYVSALDAGCGLGVFTRRLASAAENVLGVDISGVAIEQARTLSANYPNVRFEPASVTTLSSDAIGHFDLVVLADVLYYLPSLTKSDLASLIGQIVDLLEQNGILLLANHCFFNFDKSSKLVRRIHSIFASHSPLEMLREEWHPFYLTTVFKKR